MRSIFFFVLIFSACCCALAQNDPAALNGYKFVYLSTADVPPFVSVSLYEDVADQLKESGISVINRKQKEVQSDTCEIILCQVLPIPATAAAASSSSDQCKHLRFTDCNKQLVYISKTGYSGVALGGTKWGYELATAEAMQSLKQYRYVYSKNR